MTSLLVGWFSFESCGATAGDLLARDLLKRWLLEAGRDVTVATAPPFDGGPHWTTIDPREIDEVIWVCGPLGNGPPVTDFLERFAGSRLAAVDVSLLEPLDRWNPFDLLVERDSSRTANPDVAFASPSDLVPVVGIVLVHPQSEYGDRALHDKANSSIDRLLASRRLAPLKIDTRLDEYGSGLREPAEVETLISRCDAVVTTRLHGTVLALKHGVPPVVIDPIAGGAKVTRQAETIGWPHRFTADRLDDDELSRALDHCLTAEARTEAVACAQWAAESVGRVRDEFLDWLARSGA